ncbi:MAG: co-chaperone DjlA [Gammaproteobacteria bacterium]|nr:co-chaperone DjlA [Gammaproteobacteria bacterium]
MNWWGKVLGGSFGFMFGGPLGAILGTVLGHRFDKGLEGIKDQIPWHSGDQERVQTAFFTATFSIMGHIAKADGVVTREEIALAQQLMAQMQLTADQKKTAINLFNEGKAPDFPLNDLLQQFRQECHRRKNLLRMFMEIQIQAAYADGSMAQSERELLLHISKQLGFSRIEFEHLDSLIRAARQFGGGQQHYQPGQSAPTGAQQLKAAYELLDIPASSSDSEVKKAYRRMMNRHHPDKLVAKGLPEEMIKIATEKTQKIKEAYEMIKASR